MGQSFSLEPGWRVALRHLEEKEQELARSCREGEERYSGLVDLESRLKLVQTRLGMCLIMMDVMAETEDHSAHHRLFVSASRRARDAVTSLEEIRGLNISEDQRHLLTDDPDYAEAVRLLEELVLEGGAVLLESLERDRAKERAIREAVVESVAKYAEPDDRYEPIFAPRNSSRRLPRSVRTILGFLFPTLLAGDTGGPPYGIEEEEERLVVSERMRMPLSQAILYTESELLPQLRRLNEEQPGDGELQKKLEDLELQLEQFLKLKFIPRSTPVLLEKGFYTEWYAGYTPDGELLVNVALPVTYRSGTNVSRMQELALGELVRRLAGRGICRRLDEEYAYRKSLQSGIRGNSRFPSIGLDMTRSFSALKRDYPHLAALENREDFGRLLALASRGGRKALQAGVRRLLGTEARRPRRPGVPFLSDERGSII